jgi:hypothetical protein
MAADTTPAPAIAYVVHKNLHPGDSTLESGSFLVYVLQVGLDDHALKRNCLPSDPDSKSRGESN